MTQTDQWGAPATDNLWGDPEPTNDWGAPDTTDTAWGAPEEEPTSEWGAPEDNAWGNTSPESEGPAGWGDAAESTPDWGAPAADAATDYWDSVPDGDPDPEVEDWDVEDDTDGAGGSLLAAPGRVLAMPKKKLIGIGAGAIAGLAVIIGGFSLVGGDDAEAPAEDPPPAVAAEDPAPVEEEAADELAVFDSFVADLETALNDRDADAYYDLFSADSKKVLEKKVAEGAVKDIPSGARFEVTVNDGSVAGSTGALKMTLTRTQAGDSLDENMNTELVKEGADWKMVVTPKDQ